MQRKTRERVEVTEKIQVGCKWKLKGIFDHRRPKKKVLTTLENEYKDVTVFAGAGHPRGKNNTSSLGNNCQGIKSASENKRVAIDYSGEINVPKLIQENDEMHKFPLEILDSNSELFLKLLKDPNSLLVKRIRNAKNLQQAKKETVKLLYENKLAECGSNAIPRKCQKPIHNTHKSLLKRIKSQYGCPSTDVEIQSTSNSIVVLKPRQRKHERDTLLKHRDLESSKRATVNASVGQKLNLPTVSNFNQKDMEAKMHLSKMLRNAENVEHFSNKQGPRTLKNILSSPLSSPEHELFVALSQEMDRAASVFPQQMIFSACCNYEFPCDKNSLPLQNVEVSTGASFLKHADELQNVESGEKMLQNDGFSCEAYLKNIEMNDTIKPEDLNISELPFKQKLFVTSAEQSSSTTKLCYENRSSECSIQDVQLENKALNTPLVVSSSNTSGEYKVEINHDNKEREEHPSPNSVLEALFANDFTVLRSNIRYPAKSHLQPLHTDYKEALLVEEHIRTLLQTSEMYWEELSKKSIYPVQVLNTSSLSEQTLFLDFIKDILLELNQCVFDFYPRPSFIRQNTLASPILAKNMMKKFLKEIQWYLVPPATPRTLEDLAIKDIKKDENWSGRRLETEELVIQLADYLLDELIMQTTFVSQK